MEPRLRALAAGLRAQEITNVAAFTEESITRHLQELRNGYEERVRDKLPEDAVDDYIEHGIEEWRVGDVFARTLRFSLFVTMYSFLEADLHHLCLDLQLAANLTIGPSEIAGKGITRSQTYLKKIVGINFPDQDKTWSKISDYNQVRNCIVHSGGRVNDGNAAARLRKIVPTDHFAWSGGETIVIDAVFLSDATRTVAAFWNDLHSRLGRFPRKQDAG